jgi:hypothetical protein
MWTAEHTYTAKFAELVEGLGMTLVGYKERPYGGLLLAFFYHVVVVHDKRLGSA